MMDPKKHFPIKFEKYTEPKNFLSKFLDSWQQENDRLVKSFRIHYKSISVLLIDVRGRLISASEDGSIKIWIAESGECLRTLLGHAHGVTALVCVDPLGQLVSGSSDNTIKVWNMHNGTCLRTMNSEHSLGITALASIYAENVNQNRLLVATGSYQLIEIWDCSSGQLLRTLEGHQDYVKVLVVDPRNLDRLVSGSEDKTIRIWAWKKSECSRIIDGHSSHIKSLLILNNEPQTVIATTPGGTTHEVPRTSSEQSAGAMAMGPLATGGSVLINRDYLPQKTLLVSGSGDFTIKIWILETGENWRTFNGHRGAVNSLIIVDESQNITFGSSKKNTKQFSGIISASDDGTIKFWHVKTGECVRTLNDTTSNEASYSMVMNKKTNQLISGCLSGVIKIWNI